MKAQPPIINHQSSIIISKWICSQSSGATRAVDRWGDTRSRECRRSTRCTAASARAWFRAERSFRTRCASLRHRKGETGKRFKSRKVCKPFERRFTQAAQLLMNASLACESIEWRETQCSQREPVRSRYRCRRRDTHRCRMPCYSM